MSSQQRAAVATSRPAVLRAVATVGVALIGLVMLVFAAPHASAHNTLVSSDPADGSTVGSAPAAITLVFNEPAQALGSEVLVTDPNGATVSDGPVELVNASVIQPLTGELPAGVYSVTWRVTSADGHPIDGTLTFTAESATTAGVDPGPSATPETTAQATPEPESPEGTVSATESATPITAEIAEDEDAGLAAGAIIAIVVAVLAVAAIVTFVIIERRKSRTTQDQ